MNNNIVPIIIGLLFLSYAIYAGFMVSQIISERDQVCEDKGVKVFDNSHMWVEIKEETGERFCCYRDIINNELKEVCR